MCQWPSRSGARFISFFCRSTPSRRRHWGGSHGSDVSALCRSGRAQGNGCCVCSRRRRKRHSHVVRTFATTTADLIELSEWLEENGCTHVAMEATGVYWKPVWQVLATGSYGLILWKAAQVKNVPGRKTHVSDPT